MSYKVDLSKLLLDPSQKEKFYNSIENRLYNDILGDYIFSSSEALECRDRISSLIGSTLSKLNISLINSPCSED